MGCVKSKMEMSHNEKAIRSAILIQKWFRRHQARMEMQRRCNWQIFQNLEYASEQDQSELFRFFNDLITYMPRTRTGERRLSNVSLLSAKDDLVEEVIEIAPLTISMPLKKTDVDNLIALFRKKKNRLHPKFASMILREAAKNLRQLPNLMPVSTTVSQQITVCGDLHGKLDDLLVIWYKNGLPSPTNPYIFNGDFVDRGSKGLEVLLLLLASFLAFPNSVYLNRGNHEDAVLNARYGFIREVQNKYPNNHERILALIGEVYRWLPFGSIINNRVFVVHGGFSDKTNLDLVNSIDRGKYLSILRPHTDMGAEPMNNAEWQQVFDLMWSDPQTGKGCKPNQTRGAGVYWGPDVTDKFLKTNRLNFVIRSHECKPNGHEYTHDGKVLTIFSASNYYAVGSNNGAYIRLNAQLVPYFVQYISAASRTKDINFKRRRSIVENSALRELAVRIRDQRHELAMEFSKYDPEDTGYIPLIKWCESMEAVTRLSLPWRLVREKLAPNMRDNMVYYADTLELLDTDIILQAESVGNDLLESLYCNKESLEAIFHIIDTDQSGAITLEEFAAAIDILERHMPGKYSREEMLEKCRMMDIDKDGTVTLNEFMEAFRLSMQSRKVEKEQDYKRRSVSSRGSTTMANLAAKLTQSETIPEGDIDPTDCEAKTVDPV